MTDKGRLRFIQSVIEDTIADGPRPATKHQLERALRAIRIEIVRVSPPPQERPPETPAPIALNAEQERAAKVWAADDRLWTTQETVEFNLRTFARIILKLAAGASVSPARQEDAEQTVASIAAMLGWLNVPPRETLERDISALKARAQAVSPAPPEPPDRRRAWK